MHLLLPVRLLLQKSMSCSEKGTLRSLRLVSEAGHHSPEVCHNPSCGCSLIVAKEGSGWEIMGMEMLRTCKARETTKLAMLCASTARPENNANSNSRTESSSVI